MRGPPHGPPGHGPPMGDPAQYAQYQQYYAYMQQQAQYNPQYAMQLQQYYAQYGGYPPQPGQVPHQPPPPPSYAAGAPHGYQVRAHRTRQAGVGCIIFNCRGRSKQRSEYSRVLYLLRCDHKAAFCNNVHALLWYNGGSTCVYNGSIVQISTARVFSVYDDFCTKVCKVKTETNNYVRKAIYGGVGSFQ